MLYIAGLHHGGAERVIASLCENLNADRYSIRVCWRTALGDIGLELQGKGFEVVGLPEIDPTLSPRMRFLVLKRLLKEAQIDIVHTHDTGSLADAAQCRLLGATAKIVHTFHFGNYPNLKRRYMFMETVFSRLAHRLVAVGYEQAKRIRESLYLREKYLSTVYNGVEQMGTDREGDYLEAVRSEFTGRTIVGSISTLTRQKGLFVLLDAAAILHAKGVPCVFLIAGGGPLQEDLEKRIETLGLRDVVRLLGWVPRAADKLLPALDVFCQSSLWEANSIVLLEAMSAGLPIVTTDVGESRHLIDQDLNGLIAPANDPKGLADALERVVNDPEKRQSMGKLAQERFKERHTVDIMASNYEALYESMLDS